MSDLLLGVDAGGTKTVALLADLTGVVLGRGVAGGGNVRVGGMKAAAAAVSAAVAHAYDSAGLPALPVRAACLGMAGAGRPAERARVEQWAASERLADHTLVCDDAHLVLAAGLTHGWGVALISGTGSIALGRSADGRAARAGGWGPLLGDEGSGQSIARAVLRAVCRAADGRGAPTELLPAVLGRWRLASPAALIPFVHEADDLGALLAELPPLAAAAAPQGDGVAQELLAAAGSELASAAAAVARQLGLGPHLPLALAGGVLIHIADVREAALRDLERRGLGPAPVLVPEPATGALRLAVELCARQ